MENKTIRYSHEDNNEIGDVCVDEMPQNFSTLPDEVIIIVFSFLERKELLLTAALVCSRWRRLTDDWSLWRSLDLRSTKVTAAALSRIFKKCKQLLPESLNTIANCSFLENLNLSRCHVTNETLIAIAQACLYLTSLDVSFCDEFNSVGLLEILNRCTRLTKLYLRGCYEVDDDILPALPPTIEHLDISKCYFNKKRSLTHLNNLHHLRFLDVSCVKKIDDDIVAGFSNLTYLAMNRCRKVTDAGICSVVARNLMLESLHVARCINITDEALEMIARSPCRSTLESLFVQGCFVGERGIEAILVNCPKITRIIFSGIPDPVRARWTNLYPRVDIDPE